MTAPRILGQNSPAQNPYSKVIGWHFDFVLHVGAITNGQTLSITYASQVTAG